jgi:hypothetical protein
MCACVFVISTDETWVMDEIGADGGITKGKQMSECRTNLGDVRCGAYMLSV